MRWAALLVALAPTLGAAQEEPPLEEMRAQISALYAQIEVLGGALAPATQVGLPSFAGSPLERLAGIESELRRLTAKIEELEYRIDRVVRDGTARAADLDYRLCALEPGCNPRQLAKPQPIGGADIAPIGPAAPLASGAAAQSALFEAAKAAFEAGDFQAAAQGFAQHLADFPGGPLTAQAELLRGKAQARLGDLQSAARGYLAAFSEDRDGPFAPEALTELGRVMGDMGQTIEACVTLNEVDQRFATSPFAKDAKAARDQLACP